METDLFLLFAVGLGLYFVWALNRKQDHGVSRCSARTAPMILPPPSTLVRHLETRQKTAVTPRAEAKPSAVGFDADYGELQLLIKNTKPDAVFNAAVLPLTTAGKGEKKDVYMHANKLVYKLGRKADIGLQLIDVKNVYRESVEAQTRFTFDLVVQRDTPTPCSRMAILNVRMLLDYSQPLGEGFFQEYMLTKKPTPKLESITLQDIVTDYVDIASEAVTQFYAFDEAATAARESNIQQILQETRGRHNDEVRDLNILIDEHGRNAQNTPDYYKSRIPEFTGTSDTYGGRGAGMGTCTVAERLQGTY